MARFPFIAAGAVSSMAALAACTAGPSQPPPPAPAPIVNCRAPEPPLQAGAADPAIRSTAVFTLIDQGSWKFQGQGCLVSNRLSSAPTQTFTLDTKIGEFTRDGELFGNGGQHWDNTQLLPLPGNPRWQVAIASQDRGDAKYASRLGHQAVVQVSILVKDAAGVVLSQHTRSWIHDSPPPLGQEAAPPADAVDRHCLHQGLLDGKPELRDVHLLKDPKTGSVAFSACFNARPGLYLGAVSVTLTPYRDDGTLVSQQFGASETNIQPLETLRHHQPGTVVVLHGAQTLTAADLPHLAPKASVTVTYKICANAGFAPTHCQKEVTVTRDMAVTIDTITYVN